MAHCCISFIAFLPPVDQRHCVETIGSTVDPISHLKTGTNASNYLSAVLKVVKNSTVVSLSGFISLLATTAGPDLIGNKVWFNRWNALFDNYVEKVVIHVIVFKLLLYTAPLTEPLALAAETNTEAVLISVLCFPFCMHFLMLTSVH